VKSVRYNLYLLVLLLDMNRPGFHPDESNVYSCHLQNDDPQQADFRSVVSGSTRFHGRPPRLPDSGTSAVRSAVPRFPATFKPQSDFQTDDSNVVSTFLKNSVQQNTCDDAVKKSAGNQHVDANVPANVQATSSGTADEVEKLKWRAGQGPVVDLRLLVPGKVG